MRRQETEKDELVQAKDRELAQVQQQLREKDEQLRGSKAVIPDLNHHQTKVTIDSSLYSAFGSGVRSAFYTCQVSGPGLQSATVNHPTHIIVELSESSCQPCSLQQNVSAQLKLITEAAPASRSRWPWSKKPKNHLVAVVISPSHYEVSYTAVSQGQHKLHVQVNDREINGSPFTVTIYPDPTQLDHPVRVVTGLNGPYGIAFNKCGEMIVSGCHGVSKQRKKDSNHWIVW